MILYEGTILFIYTLCDIKFNYSYMFDENERYYNI
jgi:hypothetical protein